MASGSWPLRESSAIFVAIGLIAEAILMQFFICIVGENIPAKGYSLGETNITVCHQTFAVQITSVSDYNQFAQT